MGRHVSTALVAHQVHVGAPTALAVPVDHELAVGSQVLVAPRCPADPNSGAHMARRYSEVIPDADVVMLADDIGHWPQIEAPDEVLKHFFAHVDRVS